ncbi:MAG TPA: copper chaperone PCu(A)C [Roseiflexaceae bacterium]|jgi:copper(I)-binding protein|nr:copper chaperone PCu(A)C [Roseiflexaceae bacterium]
MRLRLGLLAALVALGLTACGETINGNTTTFQPNPGPALLNPPPINNAKKMQVFNAYAVSGIPTLPQQQGLNISSQALNGAVYMTIWNATGQTDQLTGAQTDVSAQPVLVELTNGGNLKEWRKVDSILLTQGGSGSAGQYVALSPMSYQIILPQLKQPLAPGSKINVTLQFAKAGPVQVEAKVVDPLAARATTGDIGGQAGAP